MQDAPSFFFGSQDYWVSHYSYPAAIFGLFNVVFLIAIKHFAIPYLQEQFLDLPPFSTYF